MLLANPFTGVTLNDNPQGCNQWSGKNCHKVFHGTNDSIEQFHVPGSSFASDPERASFYIRQGGSLTKGLPSIYKTLVLAKKPYMVGATDRMREAVSEVSRSPKFRKRLIEAGYDSLATGVPGLDHEAAISPILTRDQVKILGRMTHWGAIESPTKQVPSDWASSEDPEDMDPEEYQELMEKIKGKGFDEFIEKQRRRALMLRRA